MIIINALRIIKRFILNLKYLFFHNLQLQDYKEQNCVWPLLQYLDYLYRKEPAGVLGKPHIMTAQETLNEIIHQKKSIVRYGDGEVFLVDGVDIPFQKAEPELSKRLADILHSDDDNVLVCIAPWMWYHPNEKITKGISVNFCFTEAPGLRIVAEQHLQPGKVYGDMSCGYLIAYPDLLKLWRSIWEGRDIAVICGDRVFKKLENNVFDNSASIEYLHIPSRDAFKEYSSILDKATKIDKAKLICIIAGPTATVLAYDLAKLGYQALDVGHLAKAYDVVVRQLPENHDMRKTFYYPD